MIIRPGDNDPALRGGVPLKRVPVIPWDAYVARGLQVYHDGKVRPVIFDPQLMITADEVFQTIRLLLSAQQRKPGPIAWETVPEEVRKHFRFRDEDVDPE